MPVISVGMLAAFNRDGSIEPRALLFPLDAAGRALRVNMTSWRYINDDLRAGNRMCLFDLTGSSGSGREVRFDVRYECRTGRWWLYN